MTTFRGIAGSLEARRRLSTYAESVVAEYPGIPLPVLLTWSIAPLDAMAVWALLAAVDDEVVVLDVGTFVGVSAFIFASHPLVARVISIDPNPLVTDEVNEKTDALGVWIAPQTLPSQLRVLDVARLTLNRFPDAAAKTEFFEGYLAPGTGLDNIGTDDPKRFDFRSLDDRTSVIAFIDALHTSAGVLEDLTALFSGKPTAIAVLDDCRHYWGPFVQAGVSRFLETNPDYTFDLLADLCPGLASSNLGIVHPKGGSAATSVTEFALGFDRTVNAVDLLQREEQLTDQVSALSKEFSGLRDVLRATKDELKTAERRAAEAEDDLGQAAAELKQSLDREQLMSSELADLRQLMSSELTDLRQSTSWKLTTPLRKLSEVLRNHGPDSAP